MYLQPASLQEFIHRLFTRGRFGRGRGVRPFPYTARDVKVLWSTRDWAEAVAELPAVGPLPTRTVLVPSERVAHALRRELLRRSRPDALAGTRFLTCRDAAAEVLYAAGVQFVPGEEKLRAPRLLALFRSGLPLAHFSDDLVRRRPGWDGAFARTITDLEAGGVRAADLEAAGSSDRLRDVALIWRALDLSAGTTWTSQRICLEAALVLEGRPEIWPCSGPTLACASADLSVVEARLVRSIPGVTLALRAARPVRERYLLRMTALFGDQAGRLLRDQAAPRSARTERDLLASFLFEPPPILADRGRPVSHGPDGTVDLEEHAGVEAEIEATADWVVRQVGAGTPLEDIAVLVPDRQPLATLVVQRLARIPWSGGALPVHVAGGLPLSDSAPGSRALAVVRALRAHLCAEALAGMMPALRSAAGGMDHLSHGAAMDLVWSLGAVGGSPARPAGALEWSERVHRREADWRTQLDRARAAEGTDRAWGGRRARDLERLVRDVAAIGPALDALVGVARLVLDGVELRTLWPALRAVFSDWLLQPGDGPRVHALLDEPLGALASDSACGSLFGDDALRVIEEALCDLRVVSGRFGQPAVYVGSLRETVGVPFRAVRVIGLAEGHVPGVAREDPVVPDVLREGLSLGHAAPATAADRALQDLHALDFVVRDTAQRVALSFSRVDVERSQREPSSVMLEAAAALARPHRVTKERGSKIPGAGALRRDAFAPAREAAAAFRQLRPLGEPAWQDAVAGGSQGAPSRWRDVLATGMLAADGGSQTPGGPADGLLGALADLDVPGLAAARPISASALEKLLGCPYRFLLGQILGLESPAAPPERREIGQPHYGSLLHEAAATFFDRHGEPFAARLGTMDEWRARMSEIVGAAFTEFLEKYPLVGEAVQAQQRERLQKDLQDLLDVDWHSGRARRFVAAERAFGVPDPVELLLGDRSLFVRGRIDRIDVEGGLALVRDIKSGKPHPRLGNEVDPDPVRDVQISLYGMVAERLSEGWGIPPRIAAAYAYVGPEGPAERSFRDDFHEVLLPEARRWLGVAAGLLAERLFPRTPHAKDCRFCEFRPVCGVRAAERALAVLTAASAEVAGGQPTTAARVLAEFAALKGAAADADEED